MVNGLGQYCVRCAPQLRWKHASLCCLAELSRSRDQRLVLLVCELLAAL